VDRASRGRHLVALTAAGAAAALAIAAAPAQDRGAGGGDDLQIAPVPVELRGPVRRLGRQLVIDGGEAVDPSELPWDDESLAGVVPDPRIAALVADLGSEDLAGRERATTALRDLGIPDEQVWLQLARPAAPLGPEAHARLLEVARSRIVDAPRGALGIQMAGRMGVGDGGGVTVTGLIPNMPARKVLRAGDRIVLLDGRPVRGSQDLSEIVQMKRPGDRIRVTVMRGERDELGRVRGGPDGRPVEARLELEMEVGSRADLERFGDPGMDMIRAGSAREQMALALVRSFPAPVRVADPAWLEGEPRNVDAHPDIVALRDAVMRADPSDPVDPGSVVWRARLERLRALSRAPGLTDGERAWFDAAATRLEELLRQAAGGARP
jgi:hypothetical protein